MTRYVLTKRVYNQFRDVGIVCMKCDKPLKIGDKVEGKTTKYSHKFYHVACYDSLFHDLPDGEDNQS